MTAAGPRTTFGAMTTLATATWALAPTVKVSGVEPVPALIPTDPVTEVRSRTLAPFCPRMEN
jgi:hypothetical protein